MRLGEKILPKKNFNSYCESHLHKFFVDLACYNKLFVSFRIEEISFRAKLTTKLPNIFAFQPEKSLEI